jgi:hypothetical protein
MHEDHLKIGEDLACIRTLADDYLRAARLGLWKQQGAD